MLFERKGISKKIDKNLLENLIILNKYQSLVKIYPEKPERLSKK